MTEREMQKYRGKNLNLTCNDRRQIKGFCSIFTKALDNDPEVASLVIETKENGLIEIYQNEIKSIEVV